LFHVVVKVVFKVGGISRKERWFGVSGVKILREIGQRALLHVRGSAQREQWLIASGVKIL
jgi:hypothetical protein